MRLLIVLFALLASSVLAAEPGFWAADARSVARVTEISSPDGRSRVVATKRADGSVRLETSGAMGAGRFDLPGVGAAEVLWAPDSQALAFTGSDGGANGLYDAFVIARHDGRPRLYRVSGLVRRAFGQPVKCGWPEVPNVAAFGWRDGALLVAAQIISHSNCDSFGTFRAYAVDWRRMAIVQDHDQLAAKQRFGALMGGALRDAPDECVRTPRACWVAANHPDERP